MNNTILLIEDDDRLRRILQLVLLDAGYTVLTAKDGQEGIQTWQQEDPAMVLTDLQMKPVDGMAVLNFGQKYAPQIPIIILTAYGTVETAVSAMKTGAFDYLTKPVDNAELLFIVADALKLQEIRTKNTQEMIGSSVAMRKIRHDIEIYAQSDSSVLLSGESGTGKELAAQAIHRASPHPDGPFIRINCAAIPGALMESELFGHTAGAFTGAVSNRKGAFFKAENGTLFLDEIGDLPLNLQAKLLHAVDEKSITPVGSNTSVNINVKIISASNRNLAQMTAQKTFREDLYYRLNRVHLHIPPIRERNGDIELLLDHFLHLFCEKLNKYDLLFSPESHTILCSYSWPGNVRELKNSIERAVLTCQNRTITIDNLPSAIREENRPVQHPYSKTMSLNDQEQQLIIDVLEKCEWNQSKAARNLGITRNTLRYRMKKYGIKRK